MNWISTKDSMPDEDIDVLAYNSNTGCYCVIYRHKGNWYYSLDADYVDFDVTHYLLIPNHP